MTVFYASLSPIACLQAKFPSSGPCGWRAERWSFMQTEEWLGMEYEIGTESCKVAMGEMEENGLRKTRQFEEIRVEGLESND